LSLLCAFAKAAFPLFYSVTALRPRATRFATRPWRWNAATLVTGSVDRFDHHLGNDDYTQAGNLFRLMKPDAQKRLISNIVGSMKPVPKAIQERQIEQFLKADPAYGRGVAEGLGLNVEHLLPRETALASN